MTQEKAIKILVVDDDVEVRDTFRMMLGEYGFEVASAASGEEALQLVVLYDFDVIFSDFAMPDGDGLWLLGKVKDLGLPVPFILVTGNTDISEKDVLARGAFGFLRKPAGFKEYRSLIEAALK